MRNIRLFESYDDFLASQESVSGTGKYVEDITPGFAYVRENYDEGKYAFYNGEDVLVGDYNWGDVVYYDGTDTLKNVYWSAYTPSMGEKVGLIVMPSTHDENGVARMIAFTNATAMTETGIDNPGGIKSSRPGETVAGGNPTDSLASSVYCSYAPMGSAYEGEEVAYDSIYCQFYGAPSSPKDRGSNTRASAPATEGNPENQSTWPSDENWHYVAAKIGSGASLHATDMSSDASEHNYPNPFSSGEWYSSDGGSISPFLTDEGKHPAYECESAGLGQYNAGFDMSGYTWTKMHEGEQEPLQYAGLYQTIGTRHGDWYVPAVGEMAYLMARLGSVEFIMNELDGEMFCCPYVSKVYDGGSEVYTAGDTKVQLADSANTIEYFTSTIAIPDNYTFSPSSPVSEPGGRGGTRAVIGSAFSCNYLSVVITPGSNASVPDPGTPIVPGPDIPVIAAGIPDVQNFGLAYNPNLTCAIDGNRGFVRPFAMIKDGKIVTTPGVIRQNGHQIKDAVYAGPTVTNE